MILLDVNILVQVQREDADRHVAVRGWLGKEMRKPPGVSVSDLALSGCLRIITHPRIFNEPTPLERALEFVRDFRSRDEVRLLAPGPRHWGIFTELCRHGEARGNQIPDAYHAALAMEFGCTWLTMDRGFARFPGLEWRHPLEG